MNAGLLVPPNSTAQSIAMAVANASGQNTTGLVAATLPSIVLAKLGPNGWAARTLSLGDLASLTAAWSNGGVYPIAGVGYRVDYSDNGLAGAVVIASDSTNGTLVPLTTITIPDSAQTYEGVNVLSGGGLTGGTLTSVGTVTGNVNGGVAGTVGQPASLPAINVTQWNSVSVTGMPMPTYTQPTGFLAATFPTTVASPTNITAGTITTVTSGVSLAANQDVRNVLGYVTGSLNGNIGGSIIGGVNGSLGGSVGGNVIGGIGGTTPAATNTQVIAAVNTQTGGTVTVALTINNDASTTGANTLAAALAASTQAATAATQATSAATSAAAAQNWTTSGSVSLSAIQNSTSGILTAATNASANTNSLPSMIYSSSHEFTPTALINAPTGGGGTDTNSVATLAIVASGSIGNAALLGAINSISGGGFAGIYPLTFMVNDTNGSPIQGVNVSVGMNGVTHTYQTNASGNCSDSLNVGTYTIAAAIPFNPLFYFAPTTFVVAGTGTLTIAMQQVTITLPANPDQCLLWDVFTDQSGVGVAGQNIKWTLQSPNDSTVIGTGEFYTAGGSLPGYWSLLVAKGTGPYSITTPLKTLPTVTTDNTTNSSFQVT